MSIQGALLLALKLVASKVVEQTLHHAWQWAALVSLLSYLLQLAPVKIAVCIVSLAGWFSPSQVETVHAAPDTRGTLPSLDN